MLQELLHGLLAQTGGDAADAAADAGPGGIFATPIPVFALIFVAMYFLILRPQQKQQKEQQKFISELKKGDDVLLQNGIFGKVHEVREIDVTVELGPNMRVRALKSAVTRGLFPASATAPKADEKSEKKA